jgi:hypothetical protein
VALLVTNSNEHNKALFRVPLVWLPVVVAFCKSQPKGKNLAEPFPKALAFPSSFSKAGLGGASSSF